MLQHESRLDKAVQAARLGAGEEIVIATRMGKTVAQGHVVGSTVSGVTIRESDSVLNFYRDDLYLFSPVKAADPGPLKKIDKRLEDMTLDERVQHKLSLMGEAEKVDDSDKEVGADDKEEPEKKDDKTNDKAVAEPDSTIDVDDLPKDIKKAVISAKKIDADQLNSILGDLGDTVVTSLKKAEVDETEIHDLVSEIQKAVHKILTGGSDSKETSKRER